VVSCFRNGSNDEVRLVGDGGARLRDAASQRRPSVRCDPTLAVGAGVGAEVGMQTDQAGWKQELAYLKTLKKAREDGTCPACGH
jgi:hypothetical protein